jgi:hypothetical protein
MTLDLDRLSRKTGLVVRSLYSAARNDLFARIEECHRHERAETFDYLAGALNQSRAPVGVEPANRRSFQLRQPGDR